MEKLVSNGINYQSVPQNYILPLEKRPGKCVNACEKIPVIDLSEGKLLGHDRDETVKQILRAGQEFGVFQVVNHGIPEQVINDMMSNANVFFKMPSEDKAMYYSDDPSKFPRLLTSTGFSYEETLYWRDCFKLFTYPVEEFKHQWPEKPSKFREVVANYSVEVRGVIFSLFKLICEGLGLEESYFDGELGGDRDLMNINYYAPCPDPSLTLGLPKHCDPGLITLLIQGDVSGLQVLKDGEWIPVEPLPNAFVVNYGHQLEIISNGMLRSVEHRAVTNSSVARTSIGTFIMPNKGSLIAPAQAMVDEHSPPHFKSFLFQEFLKAYVANHNDRESTLAIFKIQS